MEELELGQGTGDRDRGLARARHTFLRVDCGLGASGALDRARGAGRAAVIDIQ